MVEINRRGSVGSEENARRFSVLPTKDSNTIQENAKPPKENSCFDEILPVARRENEDDKAGRRCDDNVTDDENDDKVRRFSIQRAWCCLRKRRTS